MSDVIDWTDAFDNSGYIADATRLADAWAKAAAQFRSNANADLDLPYGDAPRERFDLFYPDCEPKGLFVFVHGGYWHLFDKSSWSHLAEGALERGWAVALPSYPLAPEAQIAQITKATATAIEAAADLVGGPLRIAGHSAGGHLVARMSCAAGPLRVDIQRRLAGITSISGVHDLLPLLRTTMNGTLKLDRAEALAESPAHLPPALTCPVTAWVGAQERPEFLRQTRMLEERWAASGAEIEAVYERGHNHFSIVTALGDPESPLLRACLGA